jgi:hypothetical protein
MATGPEHFEAAEDLLQRVETESLDDGSVAELIGRALVHATLAQAAAYALAHDRMMPDLVADGWRKAAGRTTTKLTRSGPN